MADEYIRREDAVDACGKEYPPNTDFERGMMCQMIGDKVRIERLQPANVVPVVYGEWERHMSFGICDKCRYKYDWKATDARNFCPNCGAKMDGKGEE